MPLPALNWKLISPYQFPATTTLTPALVLDAIYALGTATTYADGTARTPGSGSAWTWGRDTTNTNNNGVTTACYGAPPLATALVQRILFAGSVNAATPTMNTDTWATGILLVGINKNSGAYNNANPASNLGWRDPAPFSSGQFSGFFRGTMALSTAYGTQNTVYMIESQEAVVVIVSGASGNSIMAAGATVDPLSSAALNAESDGRLYGMHTTGGSALTNATMNNSGPSITVGVATANSYHSMVFNVGAVATTRLCNATNIFFSTSSLAYLSGERPLVAVGMSFIAGGYAGQLRNMYFTTQGTGCQDYRYNGVSQGFGVGYSNLAVSDILMLTP